MLFAFWNVRLVKTLDIQSKMIQMSAPSQADYTSHVITVSRLLSKAREAMTRTNMTSVEPISDYGFKTIISNSNQSNTITAIVFDWFGFISYMLNTSETVWCQVQTCWLWIHTYSNMSALLKSMAELNYLPHCASIDLLKNHPKSGWLALHDALDEAN